MSHLLTRIALYGDVLFLKFVLDYKKFEEGLKLYNDKWVQYNPRKNIPREGLSITSLDGGFSGIPDLDSLKEYNDEHNVYIDEPDIKTKTPFYPYVESAIGKFKNHLGRTHLLLKSMLVGNSHLIGMVMKEKYLHLNCFYQSIVVIHHLIILF